VRQSFIRSILNSVIGFTDASPVQIQSSCIYGDPSEFRTTTLGSVYEGNTADWIDRRVLLYGAYEMPELFFLRDVSSGGVMLDIGAHKASIRCSCQKYQKETTPLSPFRRYSNNSGSM
jgi:hypothetical protein